MAEGMRFAERMSDADALMWTIEKDPMLRSTITAIAVLDSSPDPALVAARLERATRLVPRLRQRVMSSPLSVAPPRWEQDPHFDLSYHLRWLRAPGAAGLDEVLDLAEPIAMQGFDRARPLWEFYVVDGLVDGKAALIIKLHHAITDGVGAVKIALVIFDIARDAPGALDMPDAPPERVLNMAERVTDALRHERRRQFGVARRLPGTAAAAANAVAKDPRGTAAEVTRTAASVARLLRPSPRPASPLLHGRSLSVHLDTISISLDEAKRASKSVGARLNDAFVAGVLGGLQRYHDHHGRPAEELRMSMPINLRDEVTEDLAGNAFTPARFMVPLDIDDPARRMVEIKRLVAEQRAEPALSLIEPFALVLHRLPTSLTTAVFQGILKGVDVVTSNVPGVPFPVYFGGAEVVSQFAFGPMSGAATNLTLLSYRDQIHIGVNSDPSAIPDPDVYLSCLHDGFDEVLKLA